MLRHKATALNTQVPFSYFFTVGGFVFALVPFKCKNALNARYYPLSSHESNYMRSYVHERSMQCGSHAHHTLN